MSPLVGHRDPGLRRWGHDVAASQHRADRRWPLRRPRRRRRHQRGGLGGSPRRPWRVGRPHRPGRLRRLHEPGVEQPGVGRLQVPRELRAAPRLRPVPFPQPADEGLPRQHQGDLLPGDPRPHRAVPAVVRGTRGGRLLGHRPVRNAPSARVRRRAARGGRAGHRHEHRSWRRAVPGRLPRRQRLALRLLLRALGDRGRRRRRQLRRAGLGRAGRRPVGVPAARHRLRRRGHDLGPGGRQRRRPVRRRAQHLLGPDRPQHRIVYSKGIHLVVPRLTTTRHDRVLAFFDDTQRLFYVIPMGHRSVIGTTDTRIDTPFTHVTDEDREFLLGQINARLDLPRAADRRRRHRRALRRPPARGQGRGRRPGGRRLDLAEPQARDRARHRPRASSPSSAASSPTASTSARRSPSRSRRSASRSRRTCATGTASRPRRPARSSTARPG